MSQTPVIGPLSAILLCACTSSPGATLTSGNGGNSSTARDREPVSTGSQAKLYDLTIEGIPVKVRLALTPEQRRKGLQGVDALPPDQGMLFANKEKGRRGYWMKGCLIPLDIAHLDDDGTVLSVETLKPPPPGTKEEDLPRSRPPKPSRLVLEMPGGWFDRHGLGKGDRVVIPKSVPLEKAE